MERIYTFEKQAYRNKVELIGYLMIAILLYSVFQIVFVAPGILFILMAVVSGYGIMNTYVTKSNPRTITVTDNRITFSSFGEKTFQIDSLKFFRVKLVSPNYQILVRAHDGQGNRGRFWVTYAHFNDKLDLLEEFNYLERKVHPDSLRMRGRDKMGACRPHERPADEDGISVETKA